MISGQISKNTELEKLRPAKKRENKTAAYELTIIVPVFNEAESIKRIEEQLSEFVLNSSSMSACVLFVNDGSTDNSYDRIISVCNHHKHYYYINLSKNSGLSAALKAGIDATWSTYVGYIDADLQTTPEDFKLLIPYLTDYEMVIGIRTNREDPFIKRVSSKIANSFRRFMTNDGIVDTGCPLKVMWTDYAKRIPFFTGMHRFLPALIQLQNGKVKQIPVRHFPRLAGESKYNLKNRMIAPFFDCFTFRWMKKRYINYHIIDNNLE